MARFQDAWLTGRIVVGAALAAGCGGSDDGGTMGGVSAASCGVGTFAVDGTLGGSAISHQGAEGNHAWIQSGSQNTFDANLEPGGSVHAEWTELVQDGGTTSITGRITLPNSGPHAGETLNAAGGSLTKIGDEVRFELTQLTQSVQCVTAPCPADPVDGSLRGCVHWEPFVL